MFDWDKNKNKINQEKHNVSFEFAKKGFFDPDRMIVEDLEHSKEEERFFCIGKVDDAILTVRFTYRNNIIRIFGAGYWRQLRKRYEKENQIYR